MEIIVFYCLSGNDVWIGEEARIFPGVTIGDSSVIGNFFNNATYCGFVIIFCDTLFCSLGAGAWVRENVPSYAIVVGNPARIVDYRFNETQRAKLSDIKWWNWDEEKIKDNVHLLLREESVNDFIDMHWNNELSV